MGVFIYQAQLQIPVFFLDPGEPTNPTGPTGGELGRVWIFFGGLKNVSPTIWPKVKILFDGEEIRRSPVDMEKYPMIYRVLYRYQVVVWDFFHPTVCEMS